MLGRTETRTRDRMYLGRIRSVRDISRDDRARIATCSLRTSTDRLMENYSIDWLFQANRFHATRPGDIAIVGPTRVRVHEAGMCRWIGTIDVMELTLPRRGAFSSNISGESNSRHGVANGRRRCEAQETHTEYRNRSGCPISQ